MATVKVIDNEIEFVEAKEGGRWVCGCTYGKHPSYREADACRASQLQSSAVHHPPHYNKHPSGVECIDIVEHFTFNLGNAVKYIWRHGNKGGASALEDLQKAKWYLEREIWRLQHEQRS